MAVRPGLRKLSIEQKDDNDWVKCCITWEVEEIKTERTPKKDLVGLQAKYSRLRLFNLGEMSCFNQHNAVQ